MSEKIITSLEKDSPKPKQRDAINAHGKTIVSASAGSGKTFVMMEKICDIIENNEGDLGNLLAITFTRKAAAQMKEKLHDNLAKRLVAKDSPEGAAHLQEQINKAASADVCTIHEFCSRLIKTYYYAADIDGIDSSFTIAGEDEGKFAAIQKKVIDDLFERKYKSGDDDFLGLVGCYRKKRSDENLKKMISDVYKKLRYLPNYSGLLAKWKTKCFDEGVFDSCAKNYYEEARNAFLPLYEEAAGIKTDFKTPKSREKYGKLISEIKENLGKLVNSPDMFVELPEKIKTVDLRGNPSASDKDKADEAKDFCKRAEAVWNKFRLDVGDRETELKKFRRAGKIAETLCDVLTEYDGNILFARRKENVLDYSDLEHYTLKILENDGIRRHIREKYRYVFVDEFQDVNDVQNEIIRYLSDGAEETFFVGDTKQAIYGFRGSDSKIFNDTFAEFRKAGEKTHNALPLDDNFRSAENIVDAVNDIFSRAMKGKVCGIEYEEGTGEFGVGHRMTYGKLYSENAVGRVEMDYFSRSGERGSKTPGGVYSVKKDYDELSKSSSFSSHGRAIAAVIDKELSSEIYDMKTDRPRAVRPGDICILVRKGGKNTDVLRMVTYLREKGYPVSGIRSNDVLEQPEIKNLVNILECIDNPEQDIPMCAFLLSPVCGLSETDLAEIRRLYGSSTGSFCKKINFCMGKNSPDGKLSQRLRVCRDKLNAYRKLSEISGAASLIDRICDDAGWTTRYEKDGGGVMKSVRLLQDAARVGGSEMTLSEFLRILNDGGFELDSPDIAEADCIHVMTMHKAKGLEFPVVIIADVARQFAGPNIESINFDRELGFVTKWYDPESMKCGDTILDWEAKKHKEKDEISNELNVFYVACTRAMYSLHIMNSKPKEFKDDDVMKAKDYNSLVDFGALTGYTKATDDPEVTENGYKYFDRKDTGRKLSYAVILSEDVTKFGGTRETGRGNAADDSAVDGELLRLMGEAYEKEYHHKESADIPVRSFATKLRGDRKDVKAELFTDTEYWDDGSEAATSDRDKGTTYHKFLELCDFAIKDVKGIEAELSEIMPDEETKKLVSAEDLSKILSMSAFDKVPQKFYRERKFKCMLKACDVKNSESEDEILVDGIIDFMAVEGDRVRIVDYKYSEKNKKELAEEYYDQLKIYKMATSKILGIPSENISTTLINIDRLEEIPLDIKF